MSERAYEWHLVLGAPTGLAAGALATEVGIVKLDRTAESISAVLLGHGAVDILVQQPSNGVTDSDRSCPG